MPQIEKLGDAIARFVPIEPRKFGYDVMSVRPSVRPYPRIRPGDEFAFILDLESFLRKK